MKVRLSTLIVLSAALVSGAALIGMAQKVQVEDARLKSLQAAVKSEKEAIRVLQAEWAYLNRPQRIESLAARYLDMDNPDVGSMMTGAEDLPDLYVPALPVRKPAYLSGQRIVPVSTGTAKPAIRRDKTARAQTPAVDKPDIKVRGRQFRDLLNTLGADSTGVSDKAYGGEG